MCNFQSRLHGTTSQRGNADKIRDWRDALILISLFATSNSKAQLPRPRYPTLYTLLVRKQRAQLLSHKTPFFRTTVIQKCHQYLSTLARPIPPHASTIPSPSFCKPPPVSPFSNSKALSISPRKKTAKTMSRQVHHPPVPAIPMVPPCSKPPSANSCSPITPRSLQHQTIQSG